MKKDAHLIIKLFKSDFNMTNLIIIFALIWIYSFFSTITSEFKNGSNKIVWILLLIFLPVSAILYPFIGKAQVVNNENNNTLENIVLWIIFIASSMLATYGFFTIKKYYNIESSDHYGAIGQYIILIFATFVIAMILAMIFGFLFRFFNVKKLKKVIPYALVGISLFIIGGTLANVYKKNEQNDQDLLVVAEQSFNDKSYKKAYDIFLPLAEKGNSTAQYYLGEIYTLALGVEQNYLEAFKLYEKSALKNDYRAQNALANMYYFGYGVKKDYQKAIQWYTKSADQGYHWAQANLASMYLHGTGTQIDYQKAFKLYVTSSLQNNNVAYYSLGYMHYFGYGVEKDLEKAKSYYKKACELGDEKGCEEYKKI